MLGNALIQIGFYSFVVTLASVPLGLYMARVFASERTFMDPVLVPVERLIYRVCGVHPATEMTWWEYTVSMLFFSLVGMISLYAIERLQQILPLNPQGMAAVATRPGLQHCGQLHDQYQLAGLRRRIDDELPDPDGGSGLSQLRLRGGGYCNSYRGDSRLRSQDRQNPRELLVRSHPCNAMGAASDLHRVHTGARMAGNAAESERLHARQNPRKRRRRRSSLKARSRRR